MARGETPADRRIFELNMAKIINRESGAPVVNMWNVADLREEDIDFFLAITADLQAEKERHSRIQQLFREFEARHPTYGKRH
jgi:hypothetical protein